MFDPALEKYVLFGRTLKKPPEIEAAWSKYDWYKDWYSGRAVGRVESADLVKWNLTESGTAPVVMTPDLQDEPGTEIYSVNVFPYESAVHRPAAGVPRPARTPACSMSNWSSSRDGVHFTRVATGPRSSPSARSGSWERFNTSLANNPPIAVGDELRIYYGGRIYRHSPYKGKDTGPRAGGIGLCHHPAGSLRLAGGLVRRRRDLTTKPLKLSGRSLHLNAKSDFGEIVIEVLPRRAKPIARSKPIRRDSLDGVEWAEGAWRT